MNKEYDFIVGFTIFKPTGFKTMYRHFDNLETAKLFASNKALKDCSKIYVDLDFYNKSFTREQIEDAIHSSVSDYDCLIEKLNEMMYPEEFNRMKNESEVK